MTVRRPAVFLLVAVLAIAASPASAAGGGSATSATAEIVAVAPNPSAPNDAGEWIEVDLPAPTNVTGWVVDDGETVARLPNRTLSGRVILTTEPDVVAGRLANESGPGRSGNATVVALSGRLALANTGETIELRADSDVLDSVTYRDAPDGRRYVRTGSGWEWRWPGATDFQPVSARSVPARTFLLPDDPETPVAAIDGARDRVLLGAYTFSSGRVADALCRARERGVDVRVLIEREPVGGITRRSARTLDRLVDCGVDVSAIGGQGSRYGVHHPKYAVVDDRAMVLSENWKPAGTGGRASRGWGVLLDSPRVATALAETFEADAGFTDVAPWTDVRSDLDPAEEAPANGSYPTHHPTESLEVDRATVLAAPDNAEGELVTLIDGADRSIEVQQVSIGGRDDPLLNATLRAAERGVQVRVLLSGAWFVRDENRELVSWLDERARRDGLPLEARLVEPRSRFERTHVKGLIVDGEAVAVGSLNWNRHATRQNREVMVVLHDPEAAAYYRQAFLADWRGGVWRLPASLGAVTVLSAAVAAAHRHRRARFGPEPPESFGQFAS